MNHTLSVGEYLGLITLILNVLALVWGAAKLSSKLDNLADAFRDHKERVDRIEDEVNNHESDLAVLYDGRERRKGPDRRK